MHREILESIVDFPVSTELEPAIWDKEGDDYTLRKDVELTILQYLSSCPEEDLNLITKDLHIVGSIGTNLYLPETDIDIHIIPRSEVIPDSEEESTAWVQKVKKWSMRNPIFIGEHPLEIYIQVNEGQDELSDALYDVFLKSWLVGPKIYKLDYNPYSELSDVVDKVSDYSKQADLDMGELKRDLIDYDTIDTAMEQLPAEYKAKLRDDLQTKLTELEADIRELLKSKKDWVEMRHSSSTPDMIKGLSPEEAKRKRVEADGIFKFINRYGYIRIISDLEKMLQDDSKITDDEVSLMHKVIT